METGAWPFFYFERQTVFGKSLRAAHQRHQRRPNSKWQWPLVYLDRGLVHVTHHLGPLEVQEGENQDHRCLQKTYSRLSLSIPYVSVEIVIANIPSDMGC
ncbi:hypothetical protein P8C59_003858 [Phyllachora maydis]|uniref:Uncharacterized protein n=1 Tax=Phyllachora maydis TaxID=1825666 RepID=A0AAD9I176_9PEZI|nr:hypothetical protein P8C59_003858 [Phyllachora maydis]